MVSGSYLAETRSHSQSESHPFTVVKHVQPEVVFTIISLFGIEVQYGLVLVDVAAVI
jgi:hypothetical protein